MEQSHPQADIRSAFQEILRILCNIKIYCFVQKNAPLDSICS